MVQKIICLCTGPDVNAVRFPIIQSAEHSLLRISGAQTKRVAVHIDLVFLGVKMIAQRSNRIQTILFFGKSSAGFKNSHKKFLDTKEV